MRATQLQRRFDALLGKPLIGSIGHFRTRRPLPDNSNRVSIIQPTAIGDTILSSGIVAAIRDRYPSAQITILHGPSNAQAFDVIDAEFSTRLVSFARPWQALAMLRDTSPDIVVDLTPWTRITALCAMLSGAVSVGFASTGQGRSGAFDIPVSHRNDRHELDNIEAMARVFAPRRPYRMCLRLSYPAPSIALPWHRLVVCHATPGGSQSAAKSWPVGHWAALTKRVVQDGLMVGFTGTAANSALVDAILAASGAPCESAVSLCGELTLPQLAHMLQRSRALVSVDTAPVHLAGGLGTPVVALHGPTRSWRWGPRSAAAIAIDSHHPDAGYISLGFEDHRSAPEIMKGIDVDTVHAALRQVLERAGSAPPEPQYVAARNSSSR
jgi:ADP-heptose:LPS heptosyltransferase